MTQSIENNLVYVQYIIAELVLHACKSWTRGAIIPCAWSNFLHSALSPAKLPSVQALWSCEIYHIRGHLRNIFSANSTLKSYFKICEWIFHKIWMRAYIYLICKNMSKLHDCISWLLYFRKRRGKWMYAGKKPDLR